MFCKKENILLTALSCILALTVTSVKAQGLVSLSEEAMFDDGLESSPEIAVSKKTTAQPTKPMESVNPPEVDAPVALKKDSKANVNTDTVALPDVSKVAITNDEAINLFGSDNDAVVNGDLFSQMSDLEKRTALLNLELRREKLQNEIEAVKNQRRQALQQEQDKIEQQKLKNLEFEKEQERKLLVEQQKLRDLDIEFEKLRQEKILGAYKNQMLEENQRWIEHNAVFYKQIADLRKSKKDLTEAMKIKMEDIQKEALAAKKAYKQKTDSLRKEALDLQAQISVLRNRIKTLEKENEDMRLNPFANADEQPEVQLTQVTSDNKTDDLFNDEPTENDLSKLYAVTEIRGQGSELIAKLINKNGTAFYVKKGTVLQSGHIIGEITTTYVTAEKDGSNTYLYFSAGGIVPVETNNFQLESTVQSISDKTEPSFGPIPGKL